jgi:hypothetical protein
MIDTAKWHQENTRYLAAAVAAIRTRLQTHAVTETRSVTIVRTPPAKEEPRSGWRLFGRKQIALAGTQQALLPPETPAGRTDDAPPAASVPDSGDADGPPPALAMLTEQLGLTPFERDILVLCASMDLDTGMAALCAGAQDPSKPYPTFALALTVLDEPTWEALSPERPLRYWRLIEINQPSGQTLTISGLRADERIVNYLKGLNYLDDRLAPLVWPLDSDEQRDVPASQRAAEDLIVGRVKQSTPGGKLPVVQLIGRDTPSKEMVAAAVASSLGMRLYRLQTGMLPSQPADLDAFARLWRRESLLLPAALYLESPAGEVEVARTQAAQVLLARINGLVFVDTQDVWPGLSSSSLPVTVRKPSPAEQHAIWSRELGENAGEAPALLAGQFDLGLPSIREVARRALADPQGDDLNDRLWRGALAATRPRLDALAQHIEPKAKWDDIVLPAAEMKLLRQIADQVGKRSTVYEEWGFREKSSRGLGINALFAGDSGTGKTMAAEVLANHLRLNLHRIDLSAVVSKYIGETEKNLRRLFDSAEDGGAVLFFDEADALFGKRSEVKDSHDRYANIEINYLLQRMESYRGLAILATNMKGALDTAFLRRLRFIVTFPFPGTPERRAIWQRVFPDQTPLAALDFERLSRLNITGGHIHNIAMNAAFLAAHAGGQVTMPMVLEAARTEFRKLERPINEAEFRWQGVA